MVQQTFKTEKTVNDAPYYSVRCATTGNITIATALNVGDVIDDITLAEGDRVLVCYQTTSSQNGIYVVASTPYRATDFNSEADIRGGLISVRDGARNAGEIFKNYNCEPITVDSTSLVFGPLVETVSIKTGSEWNIYVDVTSGSDTSGLGTITSPFKTIERAFREVKSIYKPDSWTGTRNIFFKLAPGTYPAGDFIVPYINWTKNSALSIYILETNSNATTPSTAAYTVSESGTFSSNSANVHTETGKTWTVNALQGKFIRVKTVKTGSLPTQWSVFYPIIRNGADWIETAFASGTSSNDIDTYDIVDMSTTIDFGGGSMMLPAQRTIAFAHYFMGINCINLFQIAAGGASGYKNIQVSNRFISCTIKNSTTGTYTGANSFVTGCYVENRNNSYYTTLSATAVKLMATGSYISLSSGDGTSTNIIRNNVIWCQAGKNQRAILITQTTKGGLIFASNNKFINFSSCIEVTSNGFLIDMMLDSCTFYFDTVDRFLKTVSNLRSVNLDYNGSAPVFNSEPAVSRLDFNSSSATYYYDAPNNINCLAIAPDAYKLVNIHPKEYTQSTTTTAATTVTLETIPSNTAVSFSGTVAAADTAGTTNVWNINGVITNIAGTTTLRSTATVTAVLVGDATWAVAFTANDTNDTLGMQVVGSGTLKWKAKIVYNQINL